jgi:hypothetical protein
MDARIARPRLLTEAEIREFAARELRNTTNPRVAARKLGLSREVFLGLVAGARVHAGTLAIVRQHMSTPPGPALISDAAAGLEAVRR